MPAETAGPQQPGLFGLGVRREANLATCATFLVAYALIVALRMPNVWIKGRLWAEEGAVYFRAARLHSWVDALFVLHSGYLNIAASVAALMAARLVPLDAAPWVTSSFSLLMQLCPPLLLMTVRIPWLRDRSALALALLLLLIPYGGREIGLNSVTSQFHLGLCVILILAFPYQRGFVGTFRLFLLALAGLSGPGPAFLVPLFAFRAWRDRSKGRAVETVVLASVAALQAVLLLIHHDSGRAVGIGPRLLALVIYENLVLLPMFGLEHTSRIIGNLAGEARQGATLWPQMAIAVAASGCMAVLVWTSRNAVARWLLAGGVVMLMMSYVGALGDHMNLLLLGFGGRYAYAPTAAFALALLAIAQVGQGWRQRGPMLLVIWMIVVGMNDYTMVDPIFADGSTWAEEVAKWRADHLYAVSFWPVGWRWQIGENP